MKFNVNAPSSGKTTDLILACAADSESGMYSLIVCHSLQEVGRVFLCAEEMGLNIPQPITHREFIEHKYYGKNVNRFYIDNVDMLLQSMTPVEVAAVTATSHAQ